MKQLRTEGRPHLEAGLNAAHLFFTSQHRDSCVLLPYKGLGIITT
jgi:hypothetical protein